MGVEKSGEHGIHGMAMENCTSVAQFKGLQSKERVMRKMISTSVVERGGALFRYFF